MTCAWNCYANEGYKPTCIQRLSYMDGDAGPDPSEVEVYTNQCDADCYAKAFGDYETIKALEPLYGQEANSTCESAWKTKQALEYTFYSSGFLYDGLFPDKTSLPQWLQDEVQNLETSPVDETEVDAILEQCRTCNPSASISSVVGPAPAPAPSEAEVLVPAPAPSEGVASAPVMPPVISIPVPTEAPASEMSSAVSRVYVISMMLVIMTCALLSS